jgi:hypothetical protein
MIILDKPYASKELKEYLQQSKTPVLNNDYAAKAAAEFALNLKSEKEFKELLKTNKNLLTVSENSLKWIYDNLEDKEKINGISVMKNKTAVRKLLSPLYGNFFFKEAATDELNNIDFKSLRLPLVLKPSVGFFSVGVYIIFNENDWKKALADIETNINAWKKDYPENVIGKSLFIMEEYIEGEEYALDAYYDENGKAVILNILKHDFGSDSDVSDRLYYSGKRIIEENISPFTAFLDCVNRFFNVKNFPVHVELRVKNGKIVPIEFNPMRFAGWCTTDLSLFAYGFRTYDYFLNGTKPDWKSLLKGKDKKIYTLILLNKPAAHDCGKKFDYEALAKKFKKVLNVRKTENPDSPVFGFLFTETAEADKAELDYIVKTDLTEFTV